MTYGFRISIFFGAVRVVITGMNVQFIPTFFDHNNIRCMIQAENIYLPRRTTYTCTFVKATAMGNNTMASRIPTKSPYVISIIENVLGYPKPKNV